MNQVDIIRNILDVGSTSAKHVRMFLNVCVVLFQGEADTMHDTAVCLTVNSIDITDTSNEVNTGEFQNGSLTGLSINLNLCQVQAVCECRSRVADTGIRIQTAQTRSCVGLVTAKILGLDAFAFISS